MVKSIVRAQMRGGTRVLRTLLLTGALALASSEAQAQSESTGNAHSNQGQPWGIVGSWFGTTATGVRQLITFHADGTVLRSVQGEASIDPARPPHTPAHGVWRYLGNGRFGVTIWDLFYDVNTAQPLRYNRLRLEVTLSDDRDSASATAIVEIIDLQGVVVGSRTGSANFVRIRFEPLE